MHNTSPNPQARGPAARYLQNSSEIALAGVPIVMIGSNFLTAIVGMIKYALGFDRSKLASS